MYSKLWVRYTEADWYEQTTLGEVIDILKKQKIKRVEKIDLGILVNGNLISLFYGDEEAQLKRKISKNEVRHINSRLNSRYKDLPDGHYKLKERTLCQNT